MAVSSIEDLLDALAAGNDDRIVGTPEASWVDFKGQPYDLSTPNGCWKIAKHVAAMANAGRGVLVFGVETKVPVNAFTEVASTVKPFPVNLLDEKRLRDVIEAQVYPRPAALQCHSYPRGDDLPPKMLFVLEVPDQPEDRRAFLATRAVDDSGRKIEAFSYPIRDGGHTQWETPGVIWRDLSEARRLRKTPSTEQAVPQLSPPTDRQTRLSGRAREIDDLMDWAAATPVFQLAAMPLTPGRDLEDFYSSTGVKGAMTNIDSLRGGMGFGIGWGGDVQVRSGSLETHDPARRCLWVDPDGFTVAAAAGSGNLLAWGLDRTFVPNPDGTQPVGINPTVLAEYTLEFCRFVYSAILPRSTANGWILNLSVRRFRDVARPPYLLVPGDGPLEAGVKASSNAWNRELDCPADDELAAYALLVEFYKLYGQPPDHIPFAEHGRIQAARLRRIR